MKLYRHIKTAVCCGLIVANLLSFSAVADENGGKTLSEQIAGNADYGVKFDYSGGESYFDVLAEYKEKNYLDALPENSIEIKAENYSNVLGSVNVTSYEGETGAVLLNDSAESVEWEFTVKQSALYQIKIKYINIGNSVNPGCKSLRIDGQFPFSDAESINFSRYFKDKGKPTVNNIGDEVVSDPIEVKKWAWLTVRDSESLYNDDLKFYLQEGKHTIALGQISGELYVSEIIIAAPEKVQKYEQIKKLYDSKGYKSGSGKVYFEAESFENTLLKNSSTIASEANGEPACTPFKYGKSLINVFGGTSWQSSGSEVTYRFTVESDGLYTIAMRTLMNYRDSIPSYRKITVDGKVPFEEFNAYKFVYDSNFRTEVLSDKSHNPYYIYLTKGEHTLSFAVTQGELSDIERRMTKDEDTLSELLLKIKMIIGQNPDVNYDYELEKQIPDLISTFDFLVSDMKQTMDSLKTVCGKKMSKYYQIKSFISQIEKVKNNPISIPSKISSLNEILTSYGSWQTEMTMHPLLLDWIEILPDSKAATVKKSTFFSRFWAGTVNFVQSFVKDYNNVSVSSIGDVKIKSTISVWSARGTKWCNIMKQMMDSDFTSKTGIAIDLNILPAGQLNAGGANALLLSITSGNAPDIATGVATGSIGEFAMRNALADISLYSDFDDVSKRFNENYFTALTYNNKVFGLPETQNIMVMIYRKDIFSKFKLSIPNTWNELYDKVIPVLNQNNMQFYMPLSAGGYDVFLYQHGGDYYDKALKYTGLDSKAAYNAMVEYSNLFLLYGVPKSSNFYNRFRSGEMPVGIVDYATYMQVKSIAGDLNGKWGIALIPGIKKENGSINRSHNSLTAECLMIMEQSKKKDDAWEFLKWWTSESVQTEYANRVESQIGKSARWNTANVKSFNDLSWEKDEKQIIISSSDYAKVPPVVLGGYYTSRHITNAYNRIIVSNQNVRDSMEATVEDINRELKRRRESVNQ